jgi:hypothetical protein
MEGLWIIGGNMALWTNPDKKSGLLRAATIDFGGGVNNGITPPTLIADNESPLMSNIAPYMNGILTPCYPAVVNTPYLGPVQLIGNYNNKQVAIAYNGTNFNFYYNNAEQGTGYLGPTFTGCNFMGDFYFCSQLDGLYQYTGSGAPIQIAAATAPVGSYMTVNANRLLITGISASPNMFQACALRNVADWTSTGDAGQFTGYLESPSGEGNNGIATLTTGQVVIFKWTSYHELWGTGPIDYTVVDRFYGIGCASNATIVEIQGYLYWMGVDGIYRWNGSMPERISDPIKNYLPTITVNAPAFQKYLAATADNRFYYISLGQNSVFAYDTWNDKWWGPWQQYSTVSANVMYRDAASSNRGVFIGDNNGIVYQIDAATNTNTLSWSYETKPYSDGSLAQGKQMIDAYVTAEVWPGASLAVSLSNRERDLNDGFDWTQVGTVSANGTELPQMAKIFVTPNLLAPSYFYRIKFSGTGRVDIYGLDKRVYVFPRS